VPWAPSLALLVTLATADIETTKEIGEALKAPGIRLLDHIIVTTAGHRSLRSLGLLS
jgi:DNA repair protein RadC